MDIRTYMASMKHEEHLFWHQLLKNESNHTPYLSEYDRWNRIVNRLREGKRYPKRQNVKLDFTSF